MKVDELKMYKVNKNFKIFIVLSLLVVMIIVSIQMFSVSVYACLYDSSRSREDKAKDVKYWCQGDYPENIPSMSESISGNACNSFACAFALIKMGLLSPANGDNILTFMNKAVEASKKTDNTIPAFEDGFYFNYDGILNKMYPDVTYVEGSSDGNHKTYLSNSSNEADYIKKVKDLMAEGYYVIGCVSGGRTPQGHCIFFDCVGKDASGNEVLYIGDSAFEGLTWEEIYGGGGYTMNYLEILECKDKPSYNQKSIYDAVQASNNDNSGDNVSTNQSVNGILSESEMVYQSLVKESELTGMPSQSLLIASQKSMPNISYDSLSFDDKETIASIKEQKEAGRTTIYSAVNIFFCVVGFAVILYSILLVLALIFDNVNGVLSVSMVSILTLGKIKVVNNDDILFKENNSDKYSTARSVVFRCILLFLVGGLLISGFLPKYIMKIIGKFSN